MCQGNSRRAPARRGGSPLPTQARARRLGHGGSPRRGLEVAGRRRRPVAAAAHFCCGAYQEARPFWSWAAASCGVCVPLITLAETTHISFSEVGRAAAEDLVGQPDRGARTRRARPRTPCASGFSSLIGALDSEKKPGQRVAVELGELRRADPLDERLGRLLEQYVTERRNDINRRFHGQRGPARTRYASTVQDQPNQ